MACGWPIKKVKERGAAQCRNGGVDDSPLTRHGHLQLGEETAKEAHIPL